MEWKKNEHTATTAAAAANETYANYRDPFTNGTVAKRFNTRVRLFIMKGHVFWYVIMHFFLFPTGSIARILLLFHAFFFVCVAVVVVGFNEKLFRHRKSIFISTPRLLISILSQITFFAWLKCRSSKKKEEAKNRDENNLLLTWTLDSGKLILSATSSRINISG